MSRGSGLVLLGQDYLLTGVVTGCGYEDGLSRKVVGLLNLSLRNEDLVGCSLVLRRQEDLLRVGVLVVREDKDLLSSTAESLWGGGLWYHVHLLRVACRLVHNHDILLLARNQHLDLGTRTHVLGVRLLR